MKKLPKILFIISFLVALIPIFSKVYAQTKTCSISVVCGGVSKNATKTVSHECKRPNGTYDNDAATCQFTGGCNADGTVNNSWTINCGGGGGSGGGTTPSVEKININGIVLATDTGSQRWIKDNTCNHQYYGINLIRSDRNNTDADIAWPCDPNGGHFDMYAVETGKSNTLTLKLPDNSSYVCNTTKWSIKDRNDLNNSNDDVVVATGTGCIADYSFAKGSWDWRYGVTFTMGVTKPPLISPTPTYVCSNDGKTATINWNKEEQASFYAVRYNNSPTDNWALEWPSICAEGISGLNGDFCFDTADNNKTSATFSITPNVDNDFWIHSNRYISGNSGGYEWGSANHLNVKCIKDTSPVTYACTIGVAPSSFEFVPNQDKPLSVTLSASNNSTITVDWLDSCALGTFDLSGASSLLKTYSLLVSSSNTINVDWKAKSTNPVVAPGCNIQANIISIMPDPSSNNLPVCSVAQVTPQSPNNVAWGGKAIWGDTMCPASANSSLWSANPGLQDATINIGGLSAVTDSNGQYSIQKQFYGASTTANVYANKNGDYDFVCYKNGNTVKVKGGTNWNKETFTPGNYDIIPYFKFSPPAFITANNGEVYSAESIMLNKPSITNPEYFQTSESGTLGGLVLAKHTITSAWGVKTTENYTKNGIENYTLNLGQYLDHLISELNKGNYNIVGQDIKYIDANTLSSTGGTLSVAFNDLQTSDYKNKVIIVDGNVNITDSDSFGSDKIKSYIMATGDITITSTVAKPENVLNILGGVFSKGAIYLNREKSAFNDKYKDPTIQFNYNSSLYLNEQLQALRVANIIWREIL